MRHACGHVAIRKSGWVLVTVGSTWLSPSWTFATSPFNRQDLGMLLLNRLADVAQHDLRDTHYVEDRLVLNIASPFAEFFIRGVKKSELQFASSSHDANISERLYMNGDALPLRSGKFWNLQFQYVISPPAVFVPGIKNTVEISIFDIEEYACVTAASLHLITGDRKPVELGPASFEMQAFNMRTIGKQTISIVFSGPSNGPGCMRYLGILQH